MKIEELKKVIDELKISLKKQNKSKFTCVECFNQHKQILNWLIELNDYANGKIGINLDNPSIDGFLSLDEAISHTIEVVKFSKDNQTKLEHKQLLFYLQKLKKYREK